MVRRGDFYEDDESIEKLELAFERGRPAVSESAFGEPMQGWNTTLSVPDMRLGAWSRLGETQAAVTH